jgi:hypothetical protein
LGEGLARLEEFLEEEKARTLKYGKVKKELLSDVESIN